MLIAGFPTGVFAANCFVVAAGPGERCVVIDPGQDVESDLAEVLREHRLKPAAVILTHGHLDHVWSVTPVCGAHDIPAYIHPEDREMLADPMRGVGPQLAAMIGEMSFAEPSEVRELADGAGLGLAGALGFDLTVTHTPGHTKGSVTFGLPREADRDEPVLFTGDLLFAGSIGRTDLPGGDARAIMDSLARTVLPRPTVVCGPWPGSTTVSSGSGSTVRRPPWAASARRTRS